MKYRNSIYIDFGSFMAEAVEQAKDRIGLYNQLVDPPVRERIKNKSFLSFLTSIIWLIRHAGWKIFLAIAALIAIGLYSFYGGMATLIAINPFLAAALAITTGGGVYLLWKNRDVILATEKVGRLYSEDFFSIVKEHKRLEDRSQPIEKLLKQCIKSICIEVFHASNAEFMEKLDKED
jgi:hypothetical protein